MNHISELVLDKLVMTQKTYNLSNVANKLVFIGSILTSKFAIFALFDMMNVKVKKINSMNYKSEIIGFRNRKGKTKSFKKFVITFDKSENATSVLEKMISLQYVASK